jgi:hypothetical protein
MTQEKLISEAREWLAECFEEQGEEIAEASAAVIVANVNRFYEGGWSSFVCQSERV